MSEVATFFRNREQDPGATYQFQVKAGRLAYRFSVYSRTPVESRSLKDQESAKEKDAEAILKDLQSTLGTLGGGGLIVVTLDQGGLRHIKVTPVTASGFQPPGQFVILAPGRPAYSLPVDNKEQELPAGAHSIVPADRAAEERLGLFIGQLPWFSPDLEALVLKAIRRPSLDSRLDRVETKLFGQTSDAEPSETRTGWFGRMKSRIGRWLANPAMYRYGTVLLLAVLLGANAFLLFRVKSSVDALSARLPPDDSSPKDPAQQPEDEPTPPAGGEPEVQPAAGVPAVIGRMRDLLALLRDPNVSDENLKQLYTAHFQPFDKGSPSDQQIAAWFTKQKPPSGEAGSRPLLMGLVKLQVLKLEPQPADRTFLEAWDNITATKQVFGRMGLGRLDATGLRLVAAVSCQLGYDTPPNAPGLPSFGQSSPVLEFAPGHTCAEYTVDDIDNGLAELVKFVKDR